MKVPIGWLVSWCLYWVGHGISRVMNNAVGAHLYPIYSRVMIWSSEVQDWAGCDGPWVEVDEE